MKFLNLLPVLFLTVAGCTSVQPLDSSIIERLKTGRTAISTLDSDNKITYTNQTFYGLGVASSDTTATYVGFFNTEKVVSELFSTRLNERGLNSSVHLLPASAWSPDLVKLYSEGMRVMGSEPSNKESKRMLPAVWKDFLRTSGYDFLFLSVMRGVRVSTSNFNTKQAGVGIITDMYLYDVNNGTLIWSVPMGSFTGVPFKDSPKEVENNDFSLIREALGKSIDQIFTVNAPMQKGIDVGLSLKPKT